jgi:hypothetical protein
VRHAVATPFLFEPGSWSSASSLDTALTLEFPLVLELAVDAGTTTICECRGQRHQRYAHAHCKRILTVDTRLSDTRLRTATSRPGAKRHSTLAPSTTVPGWSPLARTSHRLLSLDASIQNRLGYIIGLVSTSARHFSIGQYAHVGVFPACVHFSNAVHANVAQHRLRKDPVKEVQRPVTNIGVCSLTRTATMESLTLVRGWALGSAVLRIVRQGPRDPYFVVQVLTEATHSQR